MTTSPPTEQQLDEITAKAAELRERLDRKNPWPSDNESYFVAEGWTNGTRNALDKLHVESLVGEVRRLRTRVADLEGPAVEARAALASLCYDHEDPGSAALGALYLISQATTGVDAPRDEAAQVLASHEAQVMRRCAEFIRDTYSGEWVADAAATLERDADITEHGCPGYEDAGRGDTVAERQLANCQHCGRPRAVCIAAPAPAPAPPAASHSPAGDRDGETGTEGAAGPLSDSGPVLADADPNALLRHAEHYLSVLHTHHTRHDNLAANYGCAGCELRDAIRAQQDADPAHPIADADNPTPLRWGLDDVQWVDDGSVIVMLSGPDLEPYWLELDPERAAVLRQNLAGPEGEDAARRTLTPNEYDAAWHAVEGAAGEEGADPGTVLHAVLNRLGIDTPAAEETATEAGR
jgi:hypothetical protein